MSLPPNGNCLSRGSPCRLEVLLPHLAEVVVERIDHWPGVHVGVFPHRGTGLTLGFKGPSQHCPVGRSIGIHPVLAEALAGWLEEHPACR